MKKLPESAPQDLSGKRGYWITTREGKRVFIEEKRYKKWVIGSTLGAIGAAAGVIAGKRLGLFANLSNMVPAQIGKVLRNAWRGRRILGSFLKFNSHVGQDAFKHSVYKFTPLSKGRYLFRNNLTYGGTNVGKMDLLVDTSKKAITVKNMALTDIGHYREGLGKAFRNPYDFATQHGFKEVRFQIQSGEQSAALPVVMGVTWADKQTENVIKEKAITNLRKIMTMLPKEDAKRYNVTKIESYIKKAEHPQDIVAGDKVAAFTGVEAEYFGAIGPAIMSNQKAWAGKIDLTISEADSVSHEIFNRFVGHGKGSSLDVGKRTSERTLESLSNYFFKEMRPAKKGEKVPAFWPTAYSTEEERTEALIKYTKQYLREEAKRTKDKAVGGGRDLMRPVDVQKRYTAMEKKLKKKLASQEERTVEKNAKLSKDYRKLLDQQNRDKMEAGTLVSKSKIIKQLEVREESWDKLTPWERNRLVEESLESEAQLLIKSWGSRVQPRIHGQTKTTTKGTVMSEDLGDGVKMFVKRSRTSVPSHYVTVFKLLKERGQKPIVLRWNFRIDGTVRTTTNIKTGVKTDRAQFEIIPTTALAEGLRTSKTNPLPTDLRFNSVNHASNFLSTWLKTSGHIAGAQNPKAAYWSKMFYYESPLSHNRYSIVPIVFTDKATGNIRWKWMIEPSSMKIAGQKFTKAFDDPIAALAWLRLNIAQKEGWVKKGLSGVGVRKGHKPLPDSYQEFKQKHADKVRPVVTAERKEVNKAGKPTKDGLMEPVGDVPVKNYTLEKTIRKYKKRKVKDLPKTVEEYNKQNPSLEDAARIAAEKEKKRLAQKAAKKQASAGKKGAIKYSGSYQLTTPDYTVLISGDGIVQSAPPSAKWMIGKSIASVLASLAKQHGSKFRWQKIS